MSGSLWRWGYHPLIVAAAFVLNLSLEAEVALAGSVRSLLVALGVALGLTVIYWALLRRQQRAALAATATIVAAISLYPIVGAWRSLVAGLGESAASVIALGLLLMVAATPAVIWLRARHGRHVRWPSSSTLNTFGVLLLVVVVAYHVVPDVLAMRPPIDPRVASDAMADEASPDIYLILLDGYPRADVLERRFQFENDHFLEELASRGFLVRDDSHSNYVFTQLTLASMFQMRHVEDIPSVAPLIGVPGTHHGAMREAINQGGAAAILRSAGYEFVATSSGYEHVTLRAAADRYIDHGHLNDLERSLLERTWALDLLDLVRPNLFTVSQRDLAVDTFDSLDSMAAIEQERPVFAFVHLPLPHLPVVLDEDGKALPYASRRFDAVNPDAMGMTEREFRDAYVDQLAYLNRRVLQAVDLLQGHSRTPPVILVMSDHGWTFDGTLDQAARFAPLFAAFTPSDPELLAEATPVNVLALILNRYLGEQLPVAENRYFLSPAGPQDLMLLQEVADPDGPEAGA